MPLPGLPWFLWRSGEDVPRKPECPTCGEKGDQFSGTARGAQAHFMARAIWQLHKLRQASTGELAAFVSRLIDDLEEIFERLFEERRH